MSWNWKWRNVVLTSLWWEQQHRCRHHIYRTAFPSPRQTAPRRRFKRVYCANPVRCRDNVAATALQAAICRFINETTRAHSHSQQASTRANQHVIKHPVRSPSWPQRYLLNKTATATATTVTATTTATAQKLSLSLYSLRYLQQQQQQQRTAHWFDF